MTDRFWSKVDLSDPDGCWNWKASSAGGHYGQFWTWKPIKKRHRAHRFAYELAVGPIPDGLLIRHKCDNPGCVNPDHLEPGTHSDNMIDALERGQRVTANVQFRRGDRCPWAKLTKDQVESARCRHAMGERCTSLAREFGISAHCMSKLLRGLSYVY